MQSVSVVVNSSELEQFVFGAISIHKTSLLSDCIDTSKMNFLSELF